MSDARHVRAGFLSVAAALAVLWALPVAARATQFSGSCSGTAATAVSPPVGLIPHPATDTSTGSGTCRGTLDGAALGPTAVGYRATFADAAAGCLTGDENGSIDIDFPGGRTLALRTQSLAGPLLLVQGSGTGAAAGLFTAFAQLLLGRQPADLNMACASGTLSSYNVNWGIATLGTVSG
jgi:hypothetical protein